MPGNCSAISRRDVGNRNGLWPFCSMPGNCSAISRRSVGNRNGLWPFCSFGKGLFFVVKSCFFGVMLVGLIACGMAYEENGNIAQTWQETYTLLLRTYSEKYDDLHFLLHDIDLDGIPELFILQRGDWVDYLDVVYTFRDEQAIFLEFGEGVAFMPYLISGSGPFLVSAPDNKAGIIAGFTRLGGGLSTSFIVVDGYRLIVKYQGEVSGAREYESITINGEIVLETEFRRVFGAYLYPRLRAYPIAEADTIVAGIDDMHVYELPHPFVLALYDFFAGNISYNPDTGEKLSNPAAYLVDVDGNGTQGVLALRNEARYTTTPFLFGKVFYMYDGKLFYKDVGVQDIGFVTHITADGNRIVNRSFNISWTYTLFSIENGRLTAAFTIRGEMGSTGLYYNYYYWTGGFGFSYLGDFLNRIPITEEEFNAIRIRYGLDRMRSLRDDDTEQILA